MSLVGGKVHKHNWNQNFAYIRIKVSRGLTLIRIDGRPLLPNFSADHTDHDDHFWDWIFEKRIIFGRDLIGLPLGVKYNFEMSVYLLRSPGDHKGPRFDKNPATFLLQAFVSRPWVLPSMLFIFWQLSWWDLESKLYWNTCMRSQLSSTMPISRFAPKGLETDKSHLWPRAMCQVIHSRLSTLWSRLQSPTWISVENP